MCTTCAHTVTLHTFARSTAHAHTGHFNDKCAVSVRLPHIGMRISARSTPAPQAAPHSVARGANASSRTVAATHAPTRAEHDVRVDRSACPLMLAADGAARRAQPLCIEEVSCAHGDQRSHPHHSMDRGVCMGHVKSHAHKIFNFSDRKAGRARGVDWGTPSCLS